VIMDCKTVMSLHVTQNNMVVILLNLQRVVAMKLNI